MQKLIGYILFSSTMCFFVTYGYSQTNWYDEAILYETGQHRQPDKQMDTIGNGNSRLDLTFLNESQTRYKVWTQDIKTGKPSDTGYFYRKLSFERFHGKDAVVVSQRICQTDTLDNSDIQTVMDRQDFHTLYVCRKNRRTGIEAYDFHGGDMNGSDSIEGNKKRGFVNSYDPAAFCFDADIETLSLLPINKVGQIFAVRFYYPSEETSAAYYLVTVEGKDDFKIIDKLYASCWKIKLAYNPEHYDYLWISTKNHILLRREQHGPQNNSFKINMLVSD